MTENRRRFEFTEGTSNKFWEIWSEKSAVFTHYGRIGSIGQTTQKDAADAAAAKKLYDTLVREKTKKGYVEQAASIAASAVSSKPAKEAKTPKPKPAKEASSAKKKEPKVKIPKLTVNNLLKLAEKSREETAERVAEAKAGPDTQFSHVVRPTNPIHFGYDFSFDQALPADERAELMKMFKRFTKVDDSGGFVVVGPSTGAKARKIAWESGTMLELEQLRQQLPPADAKTRMQRLERVLEVPSSRGWSELVMLLSTWDEATLAGALSVAKTRLEAWPAVVRTAVDAWDDRPELFELVRLGWGTVSELRAKPYFKHLTALQTQDAAGLKEHHQTLAQLTRLHLSGSSGLDAVIAQCTGLENLTVLELQQPTYNEGVSKLDLAKLLALPQLKNLTALSLYGYQLDEKGLEALVTCPQPLTRLRLQYAKLKVRAGEALARVAARKQLVSLDLKYNDLGPKGAVALFKQPESFGQLRVLDLSANEIGDAGVAGLVTAKFDSLRWLNLSSNDPKQQLTFAAAQALASATMPKLESLNLQGHPIGAKGVAALVESQTLRSLTSLCVGYCNVDLTELSQLCGAREPVPLEQISLSSSSVSGPVAWEKMTFLRGVKVLDLESLSGDAYEGLFANAPIENVHSLSLDTDYSGHAAEGFKALCAATPSLNLHFIKLSGLKITVEQATAFVGSAIGRQVHGIELMASYTSADAWKVLAEGGVPLLGSGLTDWNRMTEFGELTSFREEW